MPIWEAEQECLKIRETGSVDMIPDIHLCVYWNGNELVGPGGIEDHLAWPYKGGDGHFPSLLGVLKAQLQQLEDFKRKNRVASIAVVSPPHGETYGFTPTWDEFFSRLVGWLDESLDLRFSTIAQHWSAVWNSSTCATAQGRTQMSIVSVFGSTVQSV